MRSTARPGAARRGAASVAGAPTSASSVATKEESIGSRRPSACQSRSLSTGAVLPLSFSDAKRLCVEPLRS
eukprot:2308107-Prymnesium_polylepis.1